MGEEGCCCCVDLGFCVFEKLRVESRSLSMPSRFLTTEILPQQVTFLRAGLAVQFIQASLKSSILLPQPLATGIASMSHHLWLYCELDSETRPEPLRSEMPVLEAIILVES